MFNNAATIREQLTALTLQTYEGSWEVVVADNGSVDDSVAQVEQFEGKLPGLQVVDASGTRGVSHARNVGAEAGRGGFILYSDGDDIVTPGWVTALAGRLPDASLAGGPVEEVSLNPKYAREWGDPPVPRDRFNVVHGYLPNIRGTNLAIRREDFEALGGWNEEYLFAEDVELSWRALHAGYDLQFVPEAIVRYRRRNTITALARQQYRRATSNSRYLLLRDFGSHGYQPRSDKSEAIGSVGWAVKTAPLALVSRKRRGLFAGKLAYGLGWAVGARGRRGMRKNSTPTPG